MTLAVLMTLALPALVYSHILSSYSTDSPFGAQPDKVSAWVGFEAEVAMFCATLDDSAPYYTPVPFPTVYGGAYGIEVTACFTHSYLINPELLLCGF